ncbi:MAG: hypothetical protein WCV86_02815 [Patescibacteria group bacterium]|jgi:hypothetical protein
MKKNMLTVLHGGLARILVLFIVILGLGVPAAHAQMGPVTEIQLSETKSTVTSDNIVPFLVHALDAAGNVEEVTADAVFSENDPFGDFSANVYFPGMVGTWDVQATYNGFAVQTTITVTEGPLATIVINPNTNPEIINMNETRAFIAQGFDADNNIVAELSPTWAVQGTAGTIDESSGVFTAKAEGDATITATMGDVSAAARITVKKIATGEETPPVPPPAPATTTNTNTSSPATTGEVLGEETEDEQAAQVDEVTEVTAENVTTTAEEAVTEDCATYAWWVWMLGIIVYLVLLGVYYYTVRMRNELTIWIAPVILTAAGLWAFFALTCAGHFLWVPWILVIGGLLVTLFRPREFQPENGQEL